MMKKSVCISGSVGYSSNCGGQAWLYVDLALGLRSLGHETVFLCTWNPADTTLSPEEYAGVVSLRLAEVGLTCPLAMYPARGADLPRAREGEYMLVDEIAGEMDLYLNVGYMSDPDLVKAFARTAYFDTDPGMFQIWVEQGSIELPPHDIYLTCSPRVGCGDSRIPTCDVEWHFVPEPVSLEAWERLPPPQDGAYTTVSNWWGDEWIELDGELHDNQKRAAFLSYLDLPAGLDVPIELALTLGPGEADRRERLRLEEHGWRVRALPPPEARTVEWTPATYRSYVQASRGEWSPVKPMYRKLKTGLVFNRTLHYLASGRPAVVEDSGPHPFLDGSEEGLLRFRTVEESRACLRAVEAAYEDHCAAARALVEAHFDARIVGRRILELCL